MLPIIRRNSDSWMPDIFNDFFDNSWMERPMYTAPAINVMENEKEYDVELAAPGLDKEDFKIDLCLKRTFDIEKGVLNVHLPKKEKTPKVEAVKHIAIQ